MGKKLSEFTEKIRKSFASQRVDDPSEVEEEYVELDTTNQEESGAKVVVKTFTIEDFADVKGILDCLREGKTIALINIKPMKEKDLIELKRSINKLKKTCDAIEGDIAGFSDDWIVAVPRFAQISRSKSIAPVEGSSGPEKE